MEPPPYNPDRYDEYNESEDSVGGNSGDDDDARKPEARAAPFLFVDDKQSSSGASGGGGGIGGGGGGGATISRDKTRATREIESLAESLSVPIHAVDRGVLNTLCGNRPHQGYVLRCHPLDAVKVGPSLPDPGTQLLDGTYAPGIWLALDEVVDPQNFGALLRSAYFLGGGRGGYVDRLVPDVKLGILVCERNSAPPQSHG